MFQFMINFASLYQHCQTCKVCSQQIFHQLHTTQQSRDFVRQQLFGNLVDPKFTRSRTTISREIYLLQPHVTASEFCTNVRVAYNILQDEAPSLCVQTLQHVFKQIVDGTSL